MNLTERRKRLQELKEREKNGNNSVATSAATGSTNYSSSRAKRLAEIKQAEQQERLSAVTSELSSRVNTWFKNNENFVSNYNYRFSGFKGSYEDPYDSTINDWISSITPQKSNFDAEAASIRAIIEENKDYLNPDYVNEVLSAFDNASRVQNDILSKAGTAAEYWSQWESPDAYKRYQTISSIADMTSEQIKSYLDRDDPVAYTDDDGKEITWDSLYKSKYYKEFTGKEDFAEKSKYTSTYRGGEKFNAFSGTYTDSGFDDIMYDYINRNEKAKQRQHLTDLSSNAAFLGLDNSERGEMTDDEIATFNYLYATSGSEAAYEYIDYLTSDLNARQRESDEAYWANFAKESPVGASVFSVIESPLKGLSYIGQYADFAADGKIDENAGYNKFSYVNSAIRNEVSEKVEEKWGGVGTFTYQVGMSMADFLFNTAISGGNSAVSLAIMGTGAAADTVLAAKERNLEDWQAFTLGTAAGVIEAVTEKIGIDALFDAAKLGKGALKYILSNTLAEGAEEGLSNILNLVADTLVTWDQAEWLMAMEKYTADGKSGFEAFGHAVGDQLILDILGGAISGGVMGGGGAVVGSIGTTIQGKEYKDKFGVDIGGALAAEAVEIDPNSKFAQRMQTKAEGGKELSNRQVGKLVQRNEAAMYDNDIATMQKAAESKLTERGERGDVKKLAEIIVKAEIGEKLTRAEENALNTSDFGRSVRAEMSKASLNSDQEMDRWAEGLGTDRINAEVYGRMVAEMENEGTSVPKTEADARQVTGKLPASKADLVTDTNVGEKTAQEPTVASEGVADEVETKGATYEASEVKDAQTGEIEASEGNHIVDSDKMVEAPEGERVAIAENATTTTEAEEESTVTLEAASAKYGTQAGAMVHTFVEGQDVAKYDAAYRVAYDMGKSGVNLSYAMQSEATAYLTENQRKLAYEAGTAASKTAAEVQDAKNQAAINGKTGRRKGTVRGRDVSIDDLKQTFNDMQGRAYKYLVSVAEVTGIDIVLYNSAVNAEGRFEEAQGKFNRDENTIYIDINAGLRGIDDVNKLHRYAMLRTFSHEFTHFIEKWNPIWYNELRKVVFDTITARGENVNDLIEEKMALDKSGKMERDADGYNKASREVVAEALADILPDANFANELATKHKNIFEKLLEKLKEFVEELKTYFKTIGNSSDRGAVALKEQVGDTLHYVESIVSLFDKVAVEAVENYQKTVATEEEVETKSDFAKSFENATQAERDEVVEAINKNTKISHIAPTEIREKAVKTHSYDHFTITDDAENRITSIKFDGKPIDAVREILKNNAFVWNRTKGEWFRSGKWYGKSLVDDVISALNTAYAETQTTNTDGGIVNGTEQAERSETVHAGRDSDAQSSESGTREEDADRSRVPEAVGEAGEGYGEVYARLEVGNDASWLTDTANHITPAKGSELHKAQRDFAEQYGVECHIIKADAWKREDPATTYNGKVYVSESINEDTLLTLVPHEGTHTMKQRNFQPYMEFIDSTPDKLGLQTNEFDRLSDKVSKHRKIDIFDMTEKERTDFYDELNSFVYGLYKSGLIDDAELDFGWVPEAFNDFDAYINELAAIHEQFKKENAPKQAAVPEATAPEVDTRSLEEREKEYKKKFSSWLKHAIRQYALHYGGETFLSNGAFALRASKDMLSMARSEFVGQIYETDAPDLAKNALDNATTLMTEAPLEGTLIDNKPVYVFNIDGKQMVYDKKLLAKLDGNLLYMGSYMGTAKIIKAVDAEGHVVGFLLPMKLSYEVTNTKPSKLKSFSNKFLSQINQEVTTNVEETGTVLPHRSDGQGDTRLLAESQTEDVQGDGAERNAVDDSRERGNEAGRSDNRPDAEGTRGRSGEGDSESGDLRRDDGLSAEKLHEEVVQQISEQSTEQPKGRNFVIGDSLDLPNGEKARYKANVEAIRLVKQLEAEGRYATEAEQVILSKYVGWGGLANAFDQRKSEWAKEYTELKELLSDEEYASARGSTLNAHFTDISVIKAMYDGLAALGFEGGRLLEPSSGVGNFVGAMPEAMSAKVKSWTMVELDGITGLIAKYLYPNADIRIQGFEKANIPDNYMDVAISNVPFGSYAITDKAYPKKVTSAIHNYFFAKSLDKVRPGGIVMFITSSYTMNSKDSTVRRYIMQRADLLGAIRLPDNAFKGNAGTEVVTDILILKKRAANTAYSGEDFLEAPYKYISGYNGTYINSYFDAHPEMVLGTPTMDGGMHRGNSLTYKALEGKGSLGDQIREAFKSIKGKMEYPAAPSRERTNFAVERANKKTKENGLVVKDGKVYQNKGGELIEQTVAKGAAERISGMLEIRDAAKELMTYQQQGLNDSEIKKARTKLNKAYDAFVKKYGYINSQANKNAIKDDPDKFSIFALENYDPDKKTATKADIFSKNTIAPNRTVTSAKDVAEGLIVSINQTGGVDTALIARLTGKTEADVTRELIDSRRAFKNRAGGLEAAETYLSGNVRAKLRDAEALATLDSDYKNNVEALKSVIPADVGYQDIFVNAGTPWIPNSVYSDFAAYMLGGRNSEYRQDVDVTRNPETGNFTVELKSRYLKTNAANTQKWGTSRRSFLELFDAMLNSKSVVIKDKLSDGSFVINKDATAAANEKIENIQKEFQDWLWKDEARRTELATLYNETFNSIVTPKYNGDNLTVNGANAMKPLRPHQRNAVQRVISSGGNTLLAHKVGAGKTYEMAAAAMKLKELGLVKKPLFAVPKSLVAQWGTEFKDFFPTAKLLVAEASDFTAANRKVFMNRIANGEYDAVIVSYEQFEKLPMSDDFTRQLYQEQIDSVVAAIEEAKAEKGDKALSIKDLEKKRKSLQAKIDKLTDKAKDEDNIDFEQLGVDSLFVDEAHNFKNLFYTTSMTNVSGLGNKDGSKRAFDLYTKVRYLQQLNGGRGIVFATATPVMNSMSEMYIMQKYLQPDLINQLGLSTFDAWAKQFGEVVNGVEIKPSGQGYRVKQSFSRFKNMSELQLLFRNFADVLTDIPGLKIPKMKGGKVNVVVCEPGQFQQDYMKELEKRADNIKNVDPSEDNMLKITSDGRKISYTQRMIDPSLPYEAGCKIYRCADNVIEAYNASKDIKGTQLIFLDMATPKGKSNNETATEDIETDEGSAQLYDDLKARLRSLGIPAKEIAFIHDADTDAKKKKLFADVNDGKVRVLIGSTGKMGVGMNAQKRVVAIHHLDAPWRPGDVEQRNGRAFRQGNINDEVECFTYVTEGSFDARLWDILERKQNFINQIMNGESVGREAEDTGEVTLSAAEVKALASGSPLIMEQVQLDTDIKKLESLYRAHISAVRSAKERLLRDAGAIANYEKYIEAGKADLSARVDTYSEGKFSVKVGNTTYTDKKEAGVALMAAATANAVDTAYTTIGSFAGFEVRVIKTHEGIKGLLSGKQGYSFNTYPERTTYMITHLSAVAESIEEKIKLWEHSLAETQADMAEQEKLIAAPFGKQAELDAKRARYNEVMEILNPKEEQSLDSVAEDNVQEQSRAYLIDDAVEKFGTTANFEQAGFALPDGQMLKISQYGLSGVKHRVIEQIYDDTRGDAAIARFIQEGNVRISAASPGIEISSDISPTISQLNTISRFISNSLGKRGVFYLDITNKNGANIASVEYYDTSVSDIIYDIKAYYDRGRIPKGSVDQYQQRTEALTDREVLQLAAEKLGDQNLSEAERGALDIFNRRLAKLEALQTERTEQGRLYKEQQFGKNVDREAAAQTLNRMHVLDNQIKAANADVLSLEDKKVLGDVLKKARKVVEAEERAHGEEILKRWRDRTKNAADIKKYRDRIKKDVDALSSWITKPDHKDISKHVPDVVKTPVIEFLKSIDFMSKQQLRGGEATAADEKFAKTLENLHKVIQKQTKAYGENYSDYIDLPPGYVEKMEEYIGGVKDLVKKNSGEFVINKMTSEELRELSHIVKTLKLYITQMNSFHNNAMYRHVYEAGNDLIYELSPMASDKGKTGAAQNFVDFQNIRPAYVWERFGRAGIAIRDELQAGQSKYGFNAREIVNFTEKAFTSKEVRAYREKLHTFNIGGEKVTMRVSHMMGLYLLSKQEDSLRHILNGGIRVGNFQQRGLSKKIYSSDSHILTQTDIDSIVGRLTARQKAVADALQKFMAEKGAEWGNEVSFKRFGEALFGELNYYPINVDKLQVGQKEEFPEGASLYALLNKSFTKARNKEAANRIMLYDVFDVFANHMSSMAQYNALAIPVLDATKWLNYQQKNSNGDLIDSVKDELTRVFGSPVGNDKGYAVTFIENILKDINGTSAQGSPYDNLYLKFLHNYNIAKVSGNLRSASLQPTAIIRAGLVIDAKSILSALNPADIKTNTEEMLKYSGIAVWKNLGFYDVNISRGMHELITNDTTGLQKLTEKSLWLAETLDRVTWSAIWGAAKQEVKRKYKLSPKDAGFYELVTKTFEDAIYKTQVVDSVLTKSELMRNKGAVARTVSSFMSEPVTSLSMIIDAHEKVRRESWSKSKRYVARAYSVYVIQALAVAIAGSIPYMWRDDDEYEEWYEKFWAAAKSNFFSELDGLSKLPIVADAWEGLLSVLKPIANALFDWNLYSYSQNTAIGEIVDDAVKFVESIIDMVENENSKYTPWTAIYALIQVGSAALGAPFGSYVKEISGMWNNTVGTLYPDLKFKTYDAGERNEIKYAYRDGHLTEEEATQHLLEKGIVKNKYEAFFEIEGWKYGMGYSKFGAYYDAIVAEDEEQIKLYYDNLYGEKISEGSLKLEAIDSINSGLKTQVKEAYIDGFIDKETVYNVLVPYADMSEDDIKTELEKWDFEIEYDFSWGDRAKGYRRGEITETELKRAVMEIEDEELSDADAYIRLLNLEMANQDYDITADIASKYFEFAEPAGIDLDVFIGFKYQIKGIEGNKDRNGKTISGSKKAKIMDIINSLPLTKAQKDALYYASGYEKSTIREAPWR